LKKKKKKLDIIIQCQFSEPLIITAYLPTIHFWPIFPFILRISL